MALESYHIERIDPRIAQYVVVKNHYLHRKAPCSIAFGLFLNDELKGVIIYGSPASPPLSRGIAGPENARNVAELTRLWIADEVPKNGESYLIGNTLKLCGKEIIVSFAEPERGHIGTVYQATNWIYTGLSAKRTDWKVKGIESHVKTLSDKRNASEMREKFGDDFSLQERPRKHRYIYINAKGARKKELINSLRYPILPYPKGGVNDLTTKGGDAK